MFSQLFEMVFGCHHSNYSFPFSLRAGKARSRAASLTGTYVVCLNCGKEFAYDWNSMRIVASRPGRDAQVAAMPAKQTA